MSLLLVLLAANWAVYALTAVEMRFGAVLLLALFPLAGYAVMEVAGVRRVGLRVAAALGYRRLRRARAHALGLGARPIVADPGRHGIARAGSAAL